MQSKYATVSNVHFGGKKPCIMMSHVRHSERESIICEEWMAFHIIEKYADVYISQKDERGLAIYLLCPS